MKDQMLSRRKLLGVLAASSSTLAMGAAPMNLHLLLEGSEGERKVRAILAKHFDSEIIRDTFIRDFYQSLLLAKDHRENQEFFLEHLDDENLHERLEIYVIEEFFVSTNYIMLGAGQTAELRLTQS